MCQAGDAACSAELLNNRAEPLSETERKPHSERQSQSEAEPGGARKRAGAARIEDGVSSNNNIIRFPILDIHALTGNTRTAYLPGNTLLIDFPFPGYIYDLGHWAELMVPAFSTLMDGSWREDVRAVALARMAGGDEAAAAVMAEQSLDRVLLVNKLKQMSSWFRCVWDGRALFTGELIDSLDCL